MKDSIQLELPLFFPLTEQIPLDLDYPNNPPKYTVDSITSPISLTNTTLSNVLHINLDNVNTIVIQKKMPLYRRLMYKALGVKIQ